MIYGQDEPMLFPVADLYDSGMMQMYINAAREQYNQNREDMKEFIKTYGDFMSPFSKDIDWVDQQTRGRVNAAMQYMQENGIDPLRSAEGRAIIQNVINSTDRAGINRRKENAKLGEQYQAMKAKMIADGTYNDDYERFMLQRMGLSDFNQFDSSMGMWNRPSPSKYQDISDITSDWTKDLQPEDMGLDPTGRYRIYGIPEEKIRQAVDPNIPGFLGTDAGAYGYELAKRQLMIEGNPNPTAQQITDRLKSNIYKSASKKHTEKYTPDEYALDNAKTRNDIAANKARAATDYYYDKLKSEDALNKELILRGADANGDGKLSADERKNYAGYASTTNYKNGSKTPGTKDEKLTIFQRAAQSLGEYAVYKPSDTAKHKIVPATVDEDEIKVISKSGQYRYVLNSDQASQVLHTTDALNKNEGRDFARMRNLQTKEGLTYVFQPSSGGGKLRARVFIEDGKPVLKYYIKGSLIVVNDDYLRLTDDEKKGKTAEDLKDSYLESKIPYEMEVVEGL